MFIIHCDESPNGDLMHPDPCLCNDLHQVDDTQTMI